MKSKDQVLLERAYQFVLESSDSEVSDIKSWRAKLKEFSFDQEREKIDYAYTMAGKGFSKLYRFHALEYKLHLLSTEYSSEPGAERLKDFTGHELTTLFNWIKEWMLGILETRLFDKTGDVEMDDANNKISLRNIDVHKVPEQTREIGSKRQAGIEWDSIFESYKRLTTAQSLKEKILAVTLSLNAWHQHGGIFGINSDIYDEIGEHHVWAFAPLSMEQFDKLDSIDPKPIIREIRKELSF